jgi:hypothetical protein
MQSTLLVPPLPQSPGLLQSRQSQYQYQQQQVQPDLQPDQDQHDQDDDQPKTAHWNKDDKYDDHAFLFFGQTGEKSMEKKAEVGDTYAVLAGLLLAFCIGNLLAVNPTDFNHKLSFNLYVLFTSIATAVGFSCVMTFTMISSKIRRLLGRTLYLFGETEDPEIVINLHGKEAWEKRKASYYYPAPINEVRFPARQWYYDCDTAMSQLPTETKHVLRPGRIPTRPPFYAPYNLQALSVRAFHLMCFAFLVAMACKIFDAVDRDLAIVCVVLLGLGVVAPLVAAHFNKSLYDLN